MERCSYSVGRRHPEKEDTLIQDPFLNDFNKIIQSKSYRRLAYKTQVFTLPDNPHVRTRLMHTSEVMASSMMISENLGLNTNLCLAIAAGHDLGHTPYGHMGERLLSAIGRKKFKHHVNSVVVAQHIERKGKGLNLSYETLEGMLNHSRGSGELTVDDTLPQEYAAVMFADKISYMFSDVNDALRYGDVSEHELPDAIRWLGFNQRTRTEKVIQALLDESREKGHVQFSEGEVFEQFDELKTFMYDVVYPRLNGIVEALQGQMIPLIVKYFTDQPFFNGVDPVLLTSLLTDKECFYFQNILSTTRMPDVDQLCNFGIFEIIPYIKRKNIDYCDPDLGWKEKAIPDGKASGD
ncbi:HD domain-containing protein [Nanoarchaeota archaeon]